VILAIGVLSQSSASAFIYGVPFLIPALRDSMNLSLAQAGVYVAAPTVGLTFTLIAWGAAADRWGERIVMASGLTVATAGIAGLVLATYRDPRAPEVLLLALLALGGVGGASVNAASGRMVMGWFPITERGIAMGIRQTAQPLGVGIAGLTLPALAPRVGAFPAMALPGALCLLSAILVAAFAPDPPRPATKKDTGVRPASPYRGPTLWRVHAASALLVVPQFAIAAFTVEYLVRELHWSATAAGVFGGCMQLAGAAGRIGSGWWSDRVGSRLRPMRQLAVAAMVVLLMFSLGDLVAPWLAVLALALGAIISVADNGLGYTATAEIAGPAWSGRALGTQNTGQNVFAALTSVVLGAVIGGVGYGWGFVLAAAAPLIAIWITPVRDETPPNW
jgi:sugar phosphate permease